MVWLATLSRVGTAERKSNGDGIHPQKGCWVATRWLAANLTTRSMESVQTVRPVKNGR